MAQAAAEEAKVERTTNVDAEALDSLHVLPMSIIPLETPGLKKSSMIKNARLESVIELFRDGAAGSGQIKPGDVSDFFQDTEGSLGRDMRVLEALGSLQSFDVYSLRLELRRIDIGFSDFEALTLSESKRGELTQFMRNFTRPLMARVYGDENNDVQDVSQIIKMLAQPDRQAAIKQLQRLADELNVTIMEVPTFLDQFGDIFLSLSYFRSCMNGVTAVIPKFLSWMNEIRDNHQVRSDPVKSRMLDQIDGDLVEISKSIAGRFEFFDKRSNAFWDEINAESFRSFRDMVTAHHTSVGAVLCGLAVKMMLWKSRFPGASGGPSKRLEFLQAEIFPGLAHIKKIEKSVGIQS